MRVRRHRRYSTEFKLQLVEAYLAGDGTAKGLADEHGICHSLILIWAEKYRKGELTLDVQREEQMQEAALKVADLERKVGQLTMELDRLKRGSPSGSQRATGPRRLSPGRGHPHRTGVPLEWPRAEHLLPAAGSRARGGARRGRRNAPGQNRDHHPGVPRVRLSAGGGPRSPAGGPPATPKPRRRQQQNAA